MNTQALTFHHITSPGHRPGHHPDAEGTARRDAVDRDTVDQATGDRDTPRRDAAYDDTVYYDTRPHDVRRARDRRSQAHHEEKRRHGSRRGMNVVAAAGVAMLVAAGALILLPKDSPALTPTGPGLSPGGPAPGAPLAPAAVDATPTLDRTLVRRPDPAPPRLKRLESAAGRVPTSGRIVPRVAPRGEARVTIHSGRHAWRPTDSR